MRTASTIVVVWALNGWSPAAHALDPEPPRVAVQIEGLDEPTANSVRASLTLERQQDNPRLSDARIKALHQDAAKEMQPALQALGYYRARIDSDLRRDGPQWQAQYRIDPGAKLVLGAFSVTVSGAGRAELALQKVLREFPLKTGDVLVHARYEDGKKRLRAIAMELGYFEAKLVRHEIKVDLKVYEASGRIEMETGPRYRFGAVQFPETVIAPEFLQRLVPFKENDPYVFAKVLALQKALNDTGYFANAEVTPARAAARERRVPIVVRLSENKRYRYSAGLGFSTDTGPRVAGNWEGRYLTRYGHTANVQAKLSPVLSEALARYLLPNIHGRDTQLEFTAVALRRDLDTSKSLSARLGVGYSNIVWGWNQTFSVNYLIENFEVGSQGETTSQFLVPGVIWRRTVTDDPLFTRKGWKMSVDVQAASDSVISDASFARIRVYAKYIHALSDRDRLILRGDGGALSVSDFEKLPPLLRFFAGGDVSVRGFGFEDLGPKDRSDKVIGGRYLAVGSVEYEHYFLEKWGAAVFADAGNAFNNFGENMAYGVGVGARWRSPVGLVRADAAMGSFDGSNTFRLHIVLGPDL